MPNLLRWFVDLAREMDRGMSVMRGGENGRYGAKRAVSEPEVSIREEGVLVRMGMSGAAPEDVDVAMSGEGTLIISGVMRSEHADDRIYNLEDLEVEGFRKVVDLPEGYESGEARATFKGQTLEVSVEKSELEAEAR